MTRTKQEKLSPVQKAARKYAKKIVVNELKEKGYTLAKAKKNKKLWDEADGYYKKLIRKHEIEMKSFRHESSLDNYGELRIKRYKSKLNLKWDSLQPKKAERRRKEKQSSEVNIKNPTSYSVKPIKQIRGDTCWLASFNMLYQYHMGNIIVDESVFLESKDVKDDVKRLLKEGKEKGWTEEEIKNEIFRDSGDKIDMINDAVATTGEFKHIKTKDNYSIDDINKLLVNSGPFKFNHWKNGEKIIDKDTGRAILPPDTYAHASVVAGITQDGKLKVIDPEDGKVYFKDINWFNKQLQRSGRYYDNKGDYWDNNEDPIVIFEEK